MNRRRRVEQRLHDPPRLLDPVLAGEAGALPDQCGVEQHLVRGRPLAPLVGELHVEGDRLGLRGVGAVRIEDHSNPRRGIQLDHELVRLRARVQHSEAEPRRALEDEPDLGLRRREELPGADEERNARPAPVLDLEAESGVGLGRRALRDAVDVQIALVLATDVVRRVGRADRLEEGDDAVLDRLGGATGRGLHRGRGDHLHDVVDDDVAERADRVVEVPAVGDAEVLGHRDLDALDIVSVPHRLEHRVGEPEVEDPLEAHLPEEVVDAVELRLVDVLVQLVGELSRRLQVVPERLLDHDAPRLGQPGLREPLDHASEQEGRDLEVEDGAFGALDRLAHSIVRCGVPEVPGDVGEPRGEPVEHLGVDLLAASLDRLAGAVDQLLDRPVVDRDADDRTVEQPALLQPVERVEGHDLRQVAGDPEDHEDVRDPLLRAGGRGRSPGADGGRCTRRHRCLLLRWPTSKRPRARSTRGGSEPSRFTAACPGRRISPLPPGSER